MRCRSSQIELAAKHNTADGGAAAAAAPGDDGAAAAAVVVTEDLWLGCEACQQWRIVPQDMYSEFANTNRHWYCNMLPGITCETPAPEWQ